MTAKPLRHSVWSRRLIAVVVLEQPAGFVVHVDVEDGEEEAGIRQAGETGVIRDHKALGLVVEREVCGVRPRERESVT
jgi:hypothetical protein